MSSAPFQSSPDHPSSVPMGPHSLELSLQEMSRLFVAVSGAAVPDVRVRGVTSDLAKVEPGCLYVALHEVTSERLGDAVHRGAVAVVVEQFPSRDPGVPVLLVQDARRALGHLLDQANGQPSRTLTIAGVTGSHGRMSTSRLLASALQSAHQGVRVVTRTERHSELGGLQSILRRAKDEARGACVLPLSAMALREGEAEGVRTRCAVMTGFIPAHHAGAVGEAYESMADYFRSLPRSSLLVLPSDDPTWESFRSETRAHVLTFGIDAMADVSARIRRMDASGTSAEVKTPCGTFELRLQVVGRRKLHEALGALTAAMTLGVAPDAAIRALSDVECVPLRLERLRVPGSFGVFVDRCGRPSELQESANEVRALTQKRLILVLSSPDDLPQAKRSGLARIAEARADQVIVTESASATGESMRAITDVLRGFREPRRVRLVPERKAAIELALDLARSGDLVLVSGSSAERSGAQDRSVVRNWFLRSLEQSAGVA